MQPVAASSILPVVETHIHGVVNDLDERCKGSASSLLTSQISYL
jgi:hypothetical protein